MKSFVVMVGNELRMMLRAKAVLFWVFLFPFVFLAMMLLSYGRSQALATMHYRIDDQDASAQSRAYVELLRRAVSRDEGVELVIETAADCDGAPAAGVVCVTLPAGFGRAVADGDEVRLVARHSGEDLGTALATRLLRAVTLRFNADIAHVPMRVGLEVVDLAKNRGLSFPQYMLTGILVMSMMSSAMSNICVALADRRERNVFKMMACLPVKPGRYLLAMLVSRLLVLLLAAGVLLAAAHGLFGIPFDPVPARIAGAAVVVACGAAALLALGIALSARLASVGDAMFASNVLYVLLLFLSDLTMPLTAMPDAVRDATRWLPTSAFVTALRRVLIQGDSLASQSQQLLVMLGWTGLCAVAALWLFRWHAR